MTIRKCLYIHGTAGVPDYAAEDDRILISAIFGGRNFEAVSPGSGAIAPGHGVLSSPAMVVTANGTPMNLVHVAPGIASVRGSQANDQGAYLCPLDASEPLTVSAAHATLDRIDLVVAQVKDAEHAAHTGDEWEPEIVAGTPDASPSAPAVPEDCLVLAELRVRDAAEAGGTVIRPQDITDRRVHARAAGGITPVSSMSAVWANPAKYEVVWDDATKQLRMYDGTDWRLISQDLDNAWQSYTPALGTGMTESGTGVVRAGQYFKIGRLVYFTARWSCGSTGNVAAGNQVSLGLPPHTPDHSSGQRYGCGGRAFTSTDEFAAAGVITSALTGFATGFAYFGGVFDATHPVNWGTPGVGNSTFEMFGAYQSVA